MGTQEVLEFLRSLIGGEDGRPIIHDDDIVAERYEIVDGELLVEINGEPFAIKVEAL